MAAHLTQGSTADDRLQRLVVAMSFADDSPSSAAVRQALYALTALHIHDFQRATKLKAKAIRSLFQSPQAGLDVKDNLQRVAAGLLLSLCEV